MTDLLSSSLKRQIEDAARKAIRDEMILPTEFGALVAKAQHDLIRSGKTYICGVTIRNVRQWATSDYSKWTEAQLMGL